MLPYNSCIISISFYLNKWVTYYLHNIHSDFEIDLCPSCVVLPVVKSAIFKLLVGREDDAEGERDDGSSSTLMMCHVRPAPPVHAPMATMTNFLVVTVIGITAEQVEL